MARPHFRYVLFFISICAALVPTLGWPHVARADDKIQGRGYLFWTTDPDAPAERVEWTKVVSLLNDNLAHVQQVNLFIGCCYSGALIHAAANPKNPLAPKHVISTAVDHKVKATDAGQNGEQTPPGRLLAADEEYYESYFAYLVKRLKNQTPVATPKIAHDAAAADWMIDKSRAKNETPQYSVGAGANENLALNGGTSSSHAILIVGDAARLWIRPPKECYLALRGLNLHTAPNTLKYYQTGKSAGADGDVSYDGSGTLNNLKSSLAAIKTLADMPANQGKVLLNIFLDGHGFNTSKNVCKDANPHPNTPKQGKRMQGGRSGLSIDTSRRFWRELNHPKATVLSSPPNWVAAGPPRFFLAYSEASLSQPVTIDINGHTLGAFSIPSTSLGGMLEVELPASLIAVLRQNYLGNATLELGVTLAAGDELRLALDDDLIFDPLYPANDYGIGLATLVERRN